MPPRNKQRTTWESATECRRLAADGLTPAEIAERTGQGRSNVRNHLRCLRLLEPSIIAEWERGHPAAGIDFLRRLAVLPHEAQLESWRARAGLIVVAAHRPNWRTIERALANLNQATEGEEWRRGASDALAFVLGRTTGLGTYRRPPRRASRSARGKGSHDDNARGREAA